MQQQPTLYLMLGYPGAGKTAASNILTKLTGATHLNSDRLRIRMYNPPTWTQAEHDELYKNLDHLCEISLGGGKDVIYDANLNRYIHRREKYEIAKKTGAKVVLIYLNTDVNLAKKRATFDSADKPKNRPFGNMEPDTFDRLVSQIEPPKPEEPTIEINGAQEIEEQLKQKLGLS